MEGRDAGLTNNGAAVAATSNDLRSYAVSYSLVRNKYQLSLTKPRNALHHGRHAANKDGRSLC